MRQSLAEYVAENMVAYRNAVMKIEPHFFVSPEGVQALISYQNQLIYAYFQQLHDEELSERIAEQRRAVQ